MPIPIILLCGRAHSGKDTTADYIAAKYGIKKIALADQLKLIAQKLIELFYNTTIPIEDFYNENKERIRDMPHFNNKPFTLRAVMQNVGSEIFRDMVGRNTWCEIVKQKITGPIIVSDCRFPSEVEFFRQIPEFEVCCIKIVRNTDMIDASHQSEAYIDEIKVDHIIDNNYTISQLYSNVDSIINKLKI